MPHPSSSSRLPRLTWRPTVPSHSRRQEHILPVRPKASSLGQTELRTCHRVRYLTAQIAEGNRLGINSTPTLYINGKKLPRINDFVAVVDKE